MFNLVIKNATLPYGRRACLGITNGKVSAIATALPIEGVSQVIDADGLTVVPGMINPHIHDRTPGGEHKEDWDSIEAAALEGGITTVCPMPNTNPAMVTEEALEAKLATMGERRIHHFHWAGTRGDDPGELRSMLKHASVPGVKLFMCETTGVGGITDPKKQRAVCELAAELRCPVPTHAQDQALMDRNRGRLEKPLRLSSHCQIQTTEVEVSAVKQALENGRVTGATVWICHVSCPESVELCQDAKQRGQQVIVETGPQYLYLNETMFRDPRFGRRVKANPSLRTPEQQMRMFTYLKRGWFDVIGDDHAPHLLSEKRQPYNRCPSGMPGLQTTFALMAQLVDLDDISMEQFIALTSMNAARLLKLPNKGKVSVGADADLVLMDFDGTWHIQDSDIVSKCGWTPYRGRIVNAVPKYTIAKGVAYKTSR